MMLIRKREKSVFDVKEHLIQWNLNVLWTFFFPNVVDCNLPIVDHLGEKRIYSMSHSSFHITEGILETQVQLLYQVQQMCSSFYS